MAACSSGKAEELKAEVGIDVPSVAVKSSKELGEVGGCVPSPAGSPTKSLMKKLVSPWLFTCSYGIWQRASYAGQQHTHT